MITEDQNEGWAEAAAEKISNTLMKGIRKDLRINGPEEKKLGAFELVEKNINDFRRSVEFLIVNNFSIFDLKAEIEKIEYELENTKNQ